MTVKHNAGPRGVIQLRRRNLTFRNFNPNTEERIMPRGRPRSDKPKKRKKVTVQLIKEKHAGETTEPYKILAELLSANHGHLADAKIGLAWRMGWRSNPDGILTLGQCRKRGDLDRELDGFDFVILLNKEAWPVLNEKSKRALLDHELCHANIVIDANGEPKKNDRDRLVCRIRKHDVEEFRQIVERHGAWTQDLAKMAQAAINDSTRPLLAEAEKNGQGGQEKASGDTDQKRKDWRKTPLSEVIANPRYVELLEGGCLDTAGDLQDRMQKDGTFWNRGVKGIGDAAKEKIEDQFNAFVAEAEAPAEEGAA